MDLRLQNKVIVVAGGAQGIGEAIVEHLMGEGALPIVFDRLSGKGFTLNVDFGDQHSVAKAVRIVQEHFGHIDGLVIIAGSDDTSAPAFEENVGQHYSIAQAMLSHLKVAKGSIVNVIGAHYAAIGDVRVALTEDWAYELGDQGIRVNAVMVSDYHSPEYKSWIDRTGLPGSLWTLIRELLPLGNRLTRDEEVAGIVAFLLSRESGSVNGKLLQAGGGHIHLDRTVRAN